MVLQIIILSYKGFKVVVLFGMYIKVIKRGLNVCSCPCYYAKYTNIVLNMLMLCGMVNFYE